MKPTAPKIVIFALLLTLTGCAHVTEFAKKILGTSTSALEQARVDALRKTYTCSLDDCLNAVLSLNRDDVSVEPKTKKFFSVFLKDPRKKYLVVMGIRGNVDTTEVGIFFDKLDDRTTRIEISSLSSSAKAKVAKAVFDELNLRFSEAP